MKSRETLRSHNDSNTTDNKAGLTERFFKLIELCNACVGIKNF
jgi:hypothetical protein